MESWGLGRPQPWLNARLELPVGPLLCVINGQTRGRQTSQGPWAHRSDPAG